LLRLDALRPFGTFMLAYFAFYTFQYFAADLPLFYVNELKLTDGTIGLGSAMFHGVMVLCSLWLSRASARYGHRKVMLVSVFLFGQYPLLLGFANGPGWYYAACLTGGAVFAFLNGGLINRLMERVPADDRPAHMALHNLALNLGILAGSVLGPAVGEWIGLRETMFVAAALRVLAAVLLVWWG
jgi:predicted MFS family arabinose efflux permease